MSKSVAPVMSLLTSPLSILSGVMGLEQKSPDLAPLPAVPTSASQEVTDAAAAERTRLMKLKQGRMGLLLTSGQGVLEPANVGKALLLGG